MAAGIIMKAGIRKFFTMKQEGIGVVEIILILVILIGLVLIFKDQLTAIVNNIFQSITGDVTTIIN
ncbi:MAG: hypothetical protein K0S76_1032 [Herbinix sp.]|jgi:hypothetical protein|nr:hypothetical protein [Herbinix sp.]